MSRKPIKAYTLYPRRGGFSSKTEDYHGEIIRVAAVSIRQAYFLAGHDRWVEPTEEYPTGIISVWTNTGGPSTSLLWCGCNAYANLPHMAGITAIRRVIQMHDLIHCTGMEN